MNKSIIYFNATQEDLKDVNIRIQNKYFIQMQRIRNKMKQKSAQILKFLNACKKNSKYIKQISSTITNKQENQKQQLNKLCRKLQRQTDKFMSFYLTNLRQLQQIKNQIQLVTRDLYQKVQQQKDCLIFRLGQCVKLKEECEKIMESASDFSI